MPRDKKMKAAEDDGHGIWMKTPRTDRKQSQRLKKKKKIYAGKCKVGVT